MGKRSEQSNFCKALCVARIAKTRYNMGMIETYILQHLVAFAECGTLVAASEKAHVTQPSLTRSLKKLEDLLGVQLFERTKNTIALNPTGKLAVKYARRVLTLQKQMENEVVDFYNKTREIKIGSIAPMPLHILSERFAKVFPKTKITSQIECENDELFSALEKDKFQIIITTKNRADERFYAKEFFEEHLKVFLPKGHRLAKKSTVCLKDLADETFVMLSNLGFWSKIKQNMIPGAKFIEQKDIADLRDIVEHSTLPSFVTDYSEKAAHLPNIKKTSRVSIPITDDEVNVHFYIVCRVEMMNQMKEILEQ